MLQIPVKPIANQSFKIVLAKQNCIIALRSFNGDLYASVLVDGVYHAANRICKNGVNLIGATYLGFKGNLFFSDTQGKNDPVYSELGSRFVLMYLEEDEIG